MLNGDGTGVTSRGQTVLAADLANVIRQTPAWKAYQQALAEHNAKPRLMRGRAPSFGIDLVASHTGLAFAALLARELGVPVAAPLHAIEARGGGLKLAGQWKQYARGKQPAYLADFSGQLPSRTQLHPVEPPNLNPAQRKMWQSLQSPTARAQFVHLVTRVGGTPWYHSGNVRWLAQQAHTSVEQVLQRLHDVRIAELTGRPAPPPRIPTLAAPPPDARAALRAQIVDVNHLLNRLATARLAHPNLKQIAHWQRNAADHQQYLRMREAIGIYADPSWANQIATEVNKIRSQLAAIEQLNDVTGIDIGVGGPLYVNYVADGGHTWVVRLGTPPFGVRNEAAASILRQVMQLQAIAAHFSQHHVNGYAPRIELRFENGIDPRVAAVLERLHAKQPGTGQPGMPGTGQHVPPEHQPGITVVGARIPYTGRPDYHPSALRLREANDNLAATYREPDSYVLPPEVLGPDIPPPPLTPDQQLLLDECDLGDRVIAIPPYDPRFVRTGTAPRAYAQQLPSRPGHLLVHIHGAPEIVGYDFGSHHAAYTPKQFADMIRNSTMWREALAARAAWRAAGPHARGPEPQLPTIDLFSCSTGKEGTTGFAQQLADELGVDVIAADDVVFNDDDDHMVIFAMKTDPKGNVIPDYDQPGQWWRFRPHQDPVPADLEQELWGADAKPVDAWKPKTSNTASELDASQASLPEGIDRRNLVSLAAATGASIRQVRARLNEVHAAEVAGLAPPPSSVPALGPARPELLPGLDAARAAVTDLLDRLDQVALANPNLEIDSWRSLLERRLQLFDLVRQHGAGVRQEWLDEMAGGTPQIEAGVTLAESATDVTGIDVRVGPDATLDLVADGGRRWIWHTDQEPTGVRNEPVYELVRRIKRIQDAAALDSRHHVDGVPPRIELRFRNGIDPKVARLLERLRVLDPDTGRRLPSDRQPRIVVVGDEVPFRGRPDYDESALRLREANEPLVATYDEPDTDVPEGELLGEDEPPPPLSEDEQTFLDESDLGDRLAGVPPYDEGYLEGQEAVRQEVPSRPGHLLVDLHGNPTEVGYDFSSHSPDWRAQDLARIIRNTKMWRAALAARAEWRAADPATRGPQPPLPNIDLVSCAAGELGVRGFAQRLADELGVDVIAGDDDVLVGAGGHLGVFPEKLEANGTLVPGYDTPGKWLRFRPHAAPEPADLERDLWGDQAKSPEDWKPGASSSRRHADEVAPEGLTRWQRTAWESLTDPAAREEFAHLVEQSRETRSGGLMKAERIALATHTSLEQVLIRLHEVRVAEAAGQEMPPPAVDALAPPAPEVVAQFDAVLAAIDDLLRRLDRISETSPRLEDVAGWRSELRDHQQLLEMVRAIDDGIQRGWIGAIGGKLQSIENDVARVETAEDVTELDSHVGKDARVDLIADGGRRWVWSTEMEPTGVRNTSAYELVRRVVRIQNAALDARHHVDGVPPRIELRFANGIDPKLTRTLERLRAHDPETGRRLPDHRQPRIVVVGEEVPFRGRPDYAENALRLRETNEPLVATYEVPDLDVPEGALLGDDVPPPPLTEDEQLVLDESDLGDRLAAFPLYDPQYLKSPPMPSERTIPSRPGRLLVEIHGAPYDVGYELSPREVVLRAESFAKIIRNSKMWRAQLVARAEWRTADPATRGPEPALPGIDLPSCDVGKHRIRGFAQALADELGVDVIAPDDVVHLDSRGHLAVFPDKPDGRGGLVTDYSSPGLWWRFQPHRAEPEPADLEVDLWGDEARPPGDWQPRGSAVSARGQLPVSPQPAPSRGAPQPSPVRGTPQYAGPGIGIPTQLRTVTELLQRLDRVTAAHPGLEQARRWRADLTYQRRMLQTAQGNGAGLTPQWRSDAVQISESIRRNLDLVESARDVTGVHVKVGPKSQVALRADGGRTWIVTTGTPPFGVRNQPAQVLVRQTLALLEAAANDPRYRGPDGTPPRIELRYENGVDPAVARVLEGLRARNTKTGRTVPPNLQPKITVVGDRVPYTSPPDYTPSAQRLRQPYEPLAQTYAELDTDIAEVELLAHDVPPKPPTPDVETFLERGDLGDRLVGLPLTDDMPSAVQTIPSRPGHLLIDIHGQPHSVAYDFSGRQASWSATEFAEVIRNSKLWRASLLARARWAAADPATRGPLLPLPKIDLVACHVGAEQLRGFAQALADELGVQVIAGDDYVYDDSGGHLGVFAKKQDANGVLVRDVDRPGRWWRFLPGQRPTPADLERELWGDQAKPVEAWRRPQPTYVHPPHQRPGTRHSYAERQGGFARAAGPQRFANGVRPVDPSRVPGAIRHELHFDAHPDRAATRQDRSMVRPASDVTATEVPGSDFRPGAPTDGGITPENLKAKEALHWLQQTLPEFRSTGTSPAGAATIALAADRTAYVTVKVVPADRLHQGERPDGSVSPSDSVVARTTHKVLLEKDRHGEWLHSVHIQVAEGLDPALLRRALAHELGEVRHKLGVAKSGVKRPVRIDGHIRGRLTELEVIARELRAATAGEHNWRQLAGERDRDTYTRWLRSEANLLVGHVSRIELARLGGRDWDQIVAKYLSEPARQLLDELRYAGNIETQRAALPAEVGDLTADETRWSIQNTDLGPLVGDGDLRQPVPENLRPPVEITRGYDKRGGSRRPARHHQQAHQEQVARQTREPFGVRLQRYANSLNAGHRAMDPTRGINDHDAAMSLHATLRGEPTVAAPRTFDGFRDGDVNQPVGAELGGLGRIEDYTGGRFQALPDGTSIHDLIERLGPSNGAYGYLVHHRADGGPYVTAVYWQDGYAYHVDPVTGQTAIGGQDAYPYGRLRDAQITGVDLLLVDRDGTPMPIPGLALSAAGTRPPTGAYLAALSEADRDLWRQRANELQQAELSTTSPAPIPVTAYAYGVAERFHALRDRQARLQFRAMAQAVANDPRLLERALDTAERIAEWRGIPLEQLLAERWRAELGSVAEARVPMAELSDGPREIDPGDSGDRRKQIRDYRDVLRQRLQELLRTTTPAQREHLAEALPEVFTRINAGYGVVRQPVHLPQARHGRVHSDLGAPYDEKQGLRRPLLARDADLQDALRLPPDKSRPDELYQLHPDPTGDWVGLVDPDRHADGPDFVLAVVETYLGMPRTAAAPTMDGFRGGDVNQPVGSELGGWGRVEEVTGGRFQSLRAGLREAAHKKLGGLKGTGGLKALGGKLGIGDPSGAKAIAKEIQTELDSGYAELERRLLDAGLGATAVVLARTSPEAPGPTGIWVAMNHNGRIHYLPQGGTKVRQDRPPHTADVDRIDVLMLDGAGTPLASGDPISELSSRPETATYLRAMPLLDRIARIRAAAELQLSAPDTTPRGLTDALADTYQQLSGDAKRQFTALYAAVGEDVPLLRRALDTLDARAPYTGNSLDEALAAQWRAGLGSFVAEVAPGAELSQAANPRLVYADPAAPMAEAIAADRRRRTWEKQEAMAPEDADTAYPGEVVHPSGAELARLRRAAPALAEVVREHGFYLAGEWAGRPGIDLDMYRPNVKGTRRPVPYLWDGGDGSEPYHEWQRLQRYREVCREQFRELHKGDSRTLALLDSHDFYYAPGDFYYDDPSTYGLVLVHKELAAVAGLVAPRQDPLHPENHAYAGPKDQDESRVLLYDPELPDHRWRWPNHRERVPSTDSAPLFGDTLELDRIAPGDFASTKSYVFLTALAEQHPELIRQLGRRNDAGHYVLELHETTRTGQGAEPTGKRFRPEVTPFLPTTEASHDTFHHPDGYRPVDPAPKHHWARVFEKVMAGLDQGPTIERAHHEGYEVLRYALTRHAQAELLTQFTGLATAVTEVEPGRKGRRAVEELLRQLAGTGLPVLARLTNPREPKGADGYYSYPVAAVPELHDGKLRLRV
ncbi:MAG: toxin glutamine deamidase domain-containing protein, partial [Micromonosporaceae bacterium]